MKFLKYLLIILVLLAIMFFGNGFLTPSISYESEIVVNKPVKEAWAVMSDDTRISEWLKEIKKIELVSGAKNEVGSVYNIYFEDQDQEMIMKETVTAITPNEHIAMTFTMDFMNMDYEMHLTEEEGKTHILSKSETTGNGFMARSILSFMKGSMKKQEDTNMNNLKTVIENNTKNYFPEPVEVPVIEEVADKNNTL